MLNYLFSSLCLFCEFHFLLFSWNLKKLDSEKGWGHLVVLMPFGWKWIVSVEACRSIQLYRGGQCLLDRFVQLLTAFLYSETFVSYQCLQNSMLFTDFERRSSYDLISSLISRETYTRSEYMLERTSSVVLVLVSEVKPDWWLTNSGGHCIRCELFWRS